LSNNTEIREVLNDAERLGCNIEKTRDGHFKIFSPSGSFWGHLKLGKDNPHYLKTIQENLHNLFLQVKLKCSVCGNEEIAGDEYRARLYLRKLKNIEPYFCIECSQEEQVLMSETGIQEQKLEPLEIVQEVEAEIGQEEEIKEILEGEPVAKLKFKCDECEREFNTQQGRSMHKTRIHKSKSGPVSIIKVPLAASKESKFVEVKFSVLGFSLNYDEFIALTDELLTIREKMASPLVNRT